MALKILLSVLGLVLLNGCTGTHTHTQKSESKTSERIASPASSATTKESDTQKFKLGTREITLPSTWKNEKPSNEMRLGQYRIAKVGSDQEDGELAFFNILGGVDANLDRWAMQMGGPESLKNKRQIKTVDGCEATFAEYEGSYTSMTLAGSSGPHAGYKMLVGFVTCSNAETYQLKLTGPAATINAAKAGFEKMIESFK
jgi:hypothetical protein